MDAGVGAAAEQGAGRRVRRRKRAHELHRCANPLELVAALARYDIDLVSLVSEFVKPSFEIGVLVTGSIPWRVASEVSDLDVLVLLPGAEAIKTRRVREIAGNAVNYLPNPAPNSVGMSLFLSGIEIDVVLFFNPAVGAAAGVTAQAGDVRARDHEFLTRLTTGWVVHGERVVAAWRQYYGSDGMPARWVVREMRHAAWTLGVIRRGVAADAAAPGSVAVLGRRAATSVLRALLAAEGRYCTSIKWLLAINQLIDTPDASGDSSLREILIAGRALAFPRLLDGPGEEQAYIAELSAYCVRVSRRLRFDDERFA